MYLVVVEQNTTQIQNNNFASKIFANKWQRTKSKIIKKISVYDNFASKD